MEPFFVGNGTVCCTCGMKPETDGENSNIEETVYGVGGKNVRS